MGEKRNQPFQLSVNAFLRIDSQGSRVTSDGGLLLVRQLAKRPGLTGIIAKNKRDDRSGKNARLRSRICRGGPSAAASPGYEDVNNAKRLSQDATFHLIDLEI